MITQVNVFLAHIALALYYGKMTVFRRIPMTWQSDPAMCPSPAPPEEE
jgi:hypothetical protein